MPTLKEYALFVSLEIERSPFPLTFVAHFLQATDICCFLLDCKKSKTTGLVQRLCKQVPLVYSAIRLSVLDLKEDSLRNSMNDF